MPDNIAKLCAAAAALLEADGQQIDGTDALRVIAQEAVKNDAEVTPREVANIYLEALADAIAELVYAAVR